MEREIKFRGKSLLTEKDWIFGDLQTSGFYAIGDKRGIYRDVITDTIGQYIDRKDKNGREIYEGDVITVNGKYPKLVKYDDKYKSFGLANIEDFGKEKWMNIWQHPDNSWWTDFNGEIEVIGNIYDNPELIKKGE